MTDPAVALRQALRLLQVGEPAQAHAACAEALIAAPGDPKALHLMGLIAMALDRPDEAIDRLRQAVAADPNSPELRGNLGLALSHAGRHAEAVEQFRLGLAISPDDPTLLKELALALLEGGQAEAAIPPLTRALAVAPRDAELHGTLGRVLYRLERDDEALGPLLTAAGLAPDDAGLAVHLGLVLRRLGRDEDSLTCFETAVALDPGHAEALNALGQALTERGDYQQGETHLRAALKRRPRFADAWANLGAALLRQRKVGDAVAACTNAVRVDPDHVEGHCTLALAQLTRGQFEDGFKAHEWRWQRGASRTPRPRFDRPAWTGDLVGRTLLLHGEQGVDDTIQFARYIPLAARRVDKVVLLCHPDLRGLLATVPGVRQVVGFGETLPAFDRHAPLMSLPRLFGTTLDTVPAPVPYVAAPDGDHPAARAVRVMAGPRRRGEPLKVGICWAGRPGVPDRSCPLELLTPLTTVPGTAFFSLQKGPRAADLAGHQAPISDLGPMLGDVQDMAAAIQALDLVVTVDGTVAHLAGALGQTAWLLLTYAADWRWLLDRDDSPWYPTLRLFRQDQAGAWEPVVARLRSALAAGPGLNPRSGRR
ncbi:MAG: tetratricopeptide repeat protein [Alphaproteobacteria bacterium]